MTQKIISFSLYGNKPNFQTGAVVNVLEAKRLYPNWKCRFYTTDDEGICNQLEYLGAEIVRMDGHWLDQGYYYGSLWRFLAIDDADICIFRDADSIVSEKEVGAVNQWISTDKQWHIMHDHVDHKGKQIMAGMFGYKRHDGHGIEKDSMLQLIKVWLDGSINTLKKIDQQFLADVIYPKTNDNALFHGLNGQRFPEHTPCRYGDFVGEKILGGAMKYWDNNTSPSTFVITNKGEESFRGTYTDGMMYIKSLENDGMISFEGDYLPVVKEATERNYRLLLAEKELRREIIKLKKDLKSKM